ncbi:hypothetical protein R69919_05500 [Paraburkholderia gardini]|uniref:Transposase n=1 Tax=Paraburkholderia gardini TaxID=2823469 RepID=A0ABN7QQ86_9BURK|nr:hypothetical protein R54767_02938 [Paraburkholderia gardini]CAG4927307.1 hypothetical protein R69919_05500 [Paraburkholderia gardini]
MGSDDRRRGLPGKRALIRAYFHRKYLAWDQSKALKRQLWSTASTAWDQSKALKRQLWSTASTLHGTRVRR